MNVPLCCECLKNKAFTPKQLKISRKTPLCEGVNAFFADKKTYKGG